MLFSPVSWSFTQVIVWPSSYQLDFFASTPTELHAVSPVTSQYAGRTLRIDLHFWFNHACSMTLHHQPRALWMPVVSTRSWFALVLSANGSHSLPYTVTSPCRITTQNVSTWGISAWFRDWTCTFFVALTRLSSTGFTKALFFSYLARHYARR